MTSEMVGSECYLSYASSQDKKPKSLASSLYKAIKSTELENNLQVIGSDETAVMTGHSGGVIRILEERLPLQRSICLLDCITTFPSAMFSD